MVHHGRKHGKPWFSTMVEQLTMVIHRVRNKGATLFFAITLQNPNRSSKFFLPSHSAVNLK